MEKHAPDLPQSAGRHAFGDTPPPPSVRHFDSLPNDARIDLAALRWLMNCSRATIYRRIAAGQIPKPTKPGPNSPNLWCVGEIRALLQGGGK